MKWTQTSKNVQNPQRVAEFQSSNSTYMEDGSSSCFKEFVFVYKYIRSFWRNPSPPDHHHHPPQIFHFCFIVIDTFVGFIFLLFIIIIIRRVCICVNSLLYFCWIPSAPNHHHPPSKILYLCSIVIYISVGITFLLRIIIIIQIVYICVNWIRYFCWHPFPLIITTTLQRFFICVQF